MEYENFKLCSELSPSDVCIVVERHGDGLCERLHHQHVPRRRIAKSSLKELLRALVCRFDGTSGLGFETIVAAHLNNRKGGLPQQDPFQMKLSYPEAGVLRTYCGTNTVAWIDHVMAPSRFRQNDES